MTPKTLAAIVWKWNSQLVASVGLLSIATGISETENSSEVPSIWERESWGQKLKSDKKRSSSDLHQSPKSPKILAKVKMSKQAQKWGLETCQTFVETCLGLGHRDSPF